MISASVLKSFLLQLQLVFYAIISIRIQYQQPIENLFGISFSMSFTDINHFSISLSFSYWNITALDTQQVISGKDSSSILYMLLKHCIWPNKQRLIIDPSVVESSRRRQPKTGCTAAVEKKFGAPPNQPKMPAAAINFSACRGGRISNGASARQPKLTKASRKITAARLRGQILLKT